jgi:hypothetical protein
MKEKKITPEMFTPFFEKCLLEAAATPGFVKEYDRLNGTNLSLKGSKLELAIDKASGRLRSEIAEFAEFVRNYVYWPLMCAAKERGELLTKFGPMTQAQLDELNKMVEELAKEE